MRATICSTMCLLKVIITKSFCGREKSSHRKPRGSTKGGHFVFLSNFPSSPLYFSEKKRQEREKKKKLLIFCLCFLTVCISCRVFVAWCCCPFSSSPNSHSQKKLKVTLFHQQRLSGKNSQRNSQPLVQSGLPDHTGGNNVFESLDLGRNNKKILSEEQKKKRFWAPVRLW